MKKRVITIILCFLLQIFSWCSISFENTEEYECYDEEKILKHSEFGYTRIWAEEVVKVAITCENKKVKSSYTLSLDGTKKEQKSTPHITTRQYKSFWKYVIENELYNLKPISLETLNSDKEFEAIYGSVPPRLEAYIYTFYFKIYGKEYSFRIHDVGRIKDKRYLTLLSRINSLIKVKTLATFYSK
jgi:hypothetical protein